MLEAASSNYCDQTFSELQEQDCFAKTFWLLLVWNDYVFSDLLDQGVP
jgi:hypothetical protein